MHVDDKILFEGAPSLGEAFSVEGDDVDCVVCPIERERFAQSVSAFSEQLTPRDQVRYADMNLED